MKFTIWNFFLEYQTLHERYLSEDFFFDMGLKNIKEEDDEYDKETDFEKEKNLVKSE